uniref:Uncharacterized protein n=1 Tax=Romanomermis culicivorax TaxID=13658 RepID=A0A915HD55_ROMCU
MLTTNPVETENNNSDDNDDLDEDLTTAPSMLQLSRVACRTNTGSGLGCNSCAQGRSAIEAVSNEV